ncbi:MAG TPA: GxxExxY protein [Gemmatimonadaceae bacterium]|jgi:GxxExxY protein
MNDDALTRQVIGCFLTAYNELGFGFTESVYSAALQILFRDIGLDARREHGIDVMFRGSKIGAYRVDYLIEDVLVLELKAGSQLPPGSRAQLLTYLRTSRKEVGLVLFFGPKPEIERVHLR